MIPNPLHIAIGSKIFSTWSGPNKNVCQCTDDCVFVCILVCCFQAGFLICQFQHAEAPLQQENIASHPYHIFYISLN